MSRAGWFVVGVVLGIVVFAPLGAHLLAKLGGIAMAATAKPLPFEETLERTASHTNLKDAGKLNNPLPMEENNLLAGAQVYLEDCAVCHGLPGQA
jgi:hypothetical protein